MSSRTQGAIYHRVQQEYSAQYFRALTKEDQPSLGRTIRLPTSTCSFLPECCSRCTVLTRWSKVLLDWFQDPRSVPLYTQGTWGLKSVLSARLPICKCSPWVYAHEAAILPKVGSHCHGIAEVLTTRRYDKLSKV